MMSLSLLLQSAAASDGELSGRDLHPCSSEQSLSSNASLPSMPCGPGYEGRAASWAVCFERLLHDPLGLQLFTAFLKKEFSEENIMFWQACEDFRQIPSDQAAQLFQTARRIYERFLSEKAAMPVNIDSQAHISDDNLNAPHPAMFHVQQQQIFNLMKFDSYSRFLKSPPYQECLLAEVEGRPLLSALADAGHTAATEKPGSASSTVVTPKKSTKKAKATKAAGEDEEEGRRKVGSSVGSGGGGGGIHGVGGFPWIIGSKSSIPRTGRRGDEHDSTSDSSVDMARSNSVGSLTTTKSEFHSPPSLAASSEGQMGPVEAGDGAAQEKGRVGPLCRVLLPDGSSAVITVSAELSVREALRPLCDKRGLAVVALDVFLVNGDRLVLEQESLTLANREIRLERRILFRLDLLPITKSVGVKAKPNKAVEDVLHSVVLKYGLKLKDMVAYMHGNTDALDMSVPVSQLDGKHVVLEAANHSKEKTIDGKFKLREVNSAPASSGLASKTSGQSPAEQDAAAKGKKASQPKAKDSDEWLELLSRAQRRRADDQRGLLRKEDLVLPDFLRVAMGPEPPSCSSSSSTAADRTGQGAPSGSLTSKEQPTPQSQTSGVESQVGSQQQSTPRTAGQQPFASELSPNAHQPVSQSSSCPHLEMKQGGGPKLQPNVLQISIMFESRVAHTPAGAPGQAEKPEDLHAVAKQASHGHENKGLARLQDGSKAIGKASSEEVIVEFPHPPNSHASPSVAAPGQELAEKELVNFVCTVTAPEAMDASLNENANNSSDVKKANGQQAPESQRPTEPPPEEGGPPEKALPSLPADSDKSDGTEGSSTGDAATAESTENSRAAPLGFDAQNVESQS
ncbi:regulator of G-protein signaling 12-like isoform X2 [Lethenteron reissneri]|uniref:regulator of G-protein signaling 12-like isoform X2 n=1 Tax=Lethenteron reissneri TaxID=7753 RepID=UPI002AB783F1|nr:regulator of G-protein signaling 12-like isoform X2 [Lethenteron reissneri]